MLACVLVALVASQPVAAQNSFLEFLDAIIPAPIMEFFGRSPPESPEVGQRILSESEILELEKPKEGFVSAGEAHIFTFNLPPNGAEFPNALLTLSMLNEEGDADLFCIPTYLFNIANTPPSREFSVWRSDHSQGDDHVFISRNHELYDESKVGVQEDGQTAEAVSFVCSVVGFAAGGTDFVLELDVDHSDRELVEEEQMAMQTIYDSCCAENPGACQQWKFQRTEEGSISMDFCHISGSMCNGEGRLLRLSMSSFNLDCEFPIEAIAQLEALEKLEMNKNALKGDVSEILGSLAQRSKLEFVQLADNDLDGDLGGEEGPVCDLTHGKGLLFLNLARNSIQGGIPACLFDETSEMREIVLDGNSMGGPLPEVSEDSKIQTIRLVGVGLSGSIPESVGALTNLVALNLAENALEGPIPSNLGSALGLRSVSLGDNMLEGDIPASLTTAVNIRFIWLGNNRLEGFASGWNLEGALANSKMMVFDASNNTLMGEFPLAFLSAPRLTLLNLADNQLSGELPSVPGMFPRLTSFMFNGNMFEGEIPSDLKDSGFFNESARLRSPFKPQIDLAKNMLSGDIPEFMHADNVPQFLWGRIRLGGNQFDLDCPLENYLLHINDLVCENGDSLVDETESIAEARENPRDAFKDPFVDFSTPEADVAEEPLSDEPTEAPAEAPSSELVFDFDADVEDVSLLSSDDGSETQNVDLLVASKLGEIPSSATGPAPVGRAERSTSMAGGALVVGGAALMFIILVALVAIVVVRKKQSKKSAAAYAIADRDLEMAVPVSENVSDDTAMLEGVKSSASL